MVEPFWNELACVRAICCAGERASPVRHLSVGDRRSMVRTCLATERASQESSVVVLVPMSAAKHAAPAHAQKYPALRLGSGGAHGHQSSWPPQCGRLRLTSLLSAIVNV